MLPNNPNSACWMCWCNFSERLLLKIRGYLDNCQLGVIVLILWVYCVMRFSHWFWTHRPRPIEARPEIFMARDSFDLVLQLDVHSILIEIFCTMVTCGKKMSIKYTLSLWATYEYRQGKIGGDVKHCSHIVTFMTDADLLWKKLLMTLWWDFLDVWM